MRLLHRWIVPPALLFLLIIALTGTYMQGEALTRAYHPEPALSAQPLDTSAVPLWMSTVVAAAKRVEPDGAIEAIFLRMERSEPRARVFWTAPEREPLSIDPRTGQVLHARADASESSPSRKLARFMVELHRGDLLGLPGRWLGLACGIALLLLGITGFTMYLKIYFRGIKLRQWTPFW